MGSAKGKGGGGRVVAMCLSIESNLEEFIASVQIY